MSSRAGNNHGKRGWSAHYGGGEGEGEGGGGRQKRQAEFVGKMDEFGSAASEEGGGEGGEHQRQSSSSALSSRECGFCHKGHEEGEEFSWRLLKGAEQGVWLRDAPVRRTASSAKYAWSHFLCAWFSPCVFCNVDDETGEQVWYNVGKEMSRGSQLKCSLCVKSGATIGCCMASCPRTFHFPCALQDGWEPTISIAVTPFFCQQHRCLVAPQLMRFGAKISSLMNDSHRARGSSGMGDEEALVPFCDLALGREQRGALFATELLRIPDDPSAPRHMSYLCSDDFEGDWESVSLPRGARRDASLPGDFVYVTTMVYDLTDAATAGFHLPSAQLPSACSCTSGDCYLSSGCQCCGSANLSYSISSLLLDDAPPLLTECSMECACDRRLCSNRVTQRGAPVSSLAVRLRRGARGISRSLIARCALRKGTFICSVVGQLKTSIGSSGPPPPASHLLRDWIPDQDHHHLYVDQSVFANLSCFIRRRKSTRPGNLTRRAVRTSYHPSGIVLALFTDRDVQTGEELALSAGSSTGRRY